MIWHRKITGTAHRQLNARVTRHSSSAHEYRAWYLRVHGIHSRVCVHAHALESPWALRRAHTKLKEASLIIMHVITLTRVRVHTYSRVLTPPSRAQSSQIARTQPALASLERASVKLFVSCTVHIHANQTVLT